MALATPNRSGFSSAPRCLFLFWVAFLLVSILTPLDSLNAQEGVGSIQGALLGGILIGVIDAFGRAVFPQLAMFTMYLVMIVVLIVRPQGLLGRKL